MAMASEIKEERKYKTLLYFAWHFFFFFPLIRFRSIRSGSPYFVPSHFVVQACYCVCCVYMLCSLTCSYFEIASFEIMSQPIYSLSLCLNQTKPSASIKTDKCVARTGKNFIIIINRCECNGTCAIHFEKHLYVLHTKNTYSVGKWACW